MEGKQFWENMPVHSGETLWVKNFVEITLSHTISETNAVLCRNSRWPPKMVGKRFLGKVACRLCR